MDLTVLTFFVAPFGLALVGRSAMLPVLLALPVAVLAMFASIHFDSVVWSVSTDSVARAVLLFSVAQAGFVAAMSVVAVGFALSHEVPRGKCAPRPISPS
jgi:hypothetical protein